MDPDQLHGPAEPDALEKDVFRRIDDDAAKALEAILTPRTTSVGRIHTRSWARFLNSLYFRDRATVKNLDRRGLGWVTVAHERLLADAEDERVRDEMAALLDKADLGSLARNMVRHRLNELIQDSDAVMGFERMRWDVFTLTNEPLLATCDRPLLVNGGRARLPITFAWMTLSPTHLLLMTPWRETLAHDTVEMAGIAVQAHERLLLEQRPRCLYSKGPLPEKTKEHARGSLEPWFGDVG